MKPLVYYCRWQGATLRLRGRDQESVWGHLVYPGSDGQDVIRGFRYLLNSATLIIQKQGDEQQIQLDDMGVPLDGKV